MNVIDIEKLEGKVLQSDGSWICFCPACGEENRNIKSRDHLRVWPDLRFHCIVGSDKIHNARILQLIGTEVNENTIISYSPVNEQPKIEIEKSWNLDILTKLLQDFTYFEGRGISRETQEHFRMGVALSGQLQNRVIIPIFDEQKRKIIGFTGRHIKWDKWHKENKIPKWKHLGGSGNFLFVGSKRAVLDTGEIIIVEGPGDVLALFEVGIKNVMCIFGTKLSSKQLAYIIRVNPKRILVALNNEPGNKNIGLIAAEKLIRTLGNYFCEDKICLALPVKKDFLQSLESEEDKKDIELWSKTWLK